MKPRPKIRFFINITTIFCFIVFISAGFAGDTDATQQEQNSGIKTTELPDKPETKSPSNHENRQRYSYRFYPSCSVYYDVDRNLYYYLEDNDWKISSSLPSNLERKLGDYVKIEMENDKPYSDHKKHVEKFPTTESQKLKPNIWSKLFFFLLYEHTPR